MYWEINTIAFYFPSLGKNHREMETCFKVALLSAYAKTG